MRKRETTRLHRFPQIRKKGRKTKKDKMEKEEKQSLFVFGCVVVVFIGMKILEVGQTKK